MLEASISSLKPWKAFRLDNIVIDHKSNILNARPSPVVTPVNLWLYAIRKSLKINKLKKKNFNEDLRDSIAITRKGLSSGPKSYLPVFNYTYKHIEGLYSQYNGPTGKERLIPEL